MPIDFEHLYGGLNPGPMVELFTIDFSTSFNWPVSPSVSAVIQICNERDDVVFDGDTYSKTAVAWDQPAIELNGKLPESKFRVFGQDNTFLATLFDVGDSVLGATCVRTVTMRKFLDGESEADTTQKFDEIWFFDDIISRTPDEIVYDMSVALGLEKFFLPALPSITRDVFNV